MIDDLKNDSEKPSITKVNIPSRFSMSTISLYKDIGNKHDVYRGKEVTNKRTAGTM